MANLVELVKQAALEAVAAAHPAQAVFGKVTDTEPLAVRIHQKLRLTAEFLALSETVRTKLAAKSLRPGDTLLLLQQQGGQRFLALDVLPGADWTPPAAAPVTWADIAGKPAAFPPAPHAHCEIAREIAAQYDPRAEIGGFVRHRLDTKQFGRVAAQTARNIIRQGIRDSERGQMMQEFKSRHQELVSALVERVDPKTGALSLKIGKAEAVLPKSEQVGTEDVREGDFVQVYVVDVKETEKGPKAIISRTHPDLIRRLFEKEVPEIFDGTVEIKAVAREAGSRTKIAVLSHNPDVDAVGACIGTRGARVTDIVNELGGEKMDIVDYSEDPGKFIAAALAPATVLSVEPAEDGSRTCKVTVPDSQLSLAIGNKGQNARLAAKLTGWKIDIKPESGFFGEDEA